MVSKRIQEMITATEIQIRMSDCFNRQKELESTMLTMIKSICGRVFRLLEREQLEAEKQRQRMTDDGSPLL